MTPLPENFLTTFIVPDNAVIDDQKIATEADMIIGNHAAIERSIEGGFLMIGEGVHIGGEVFSNDDVRADVWCKFDKNVNVGGDAYIGEFTTIDGKIVVEGDLDIGKEVKLNGGFLSKGWVVVRNPLPVMVFIFLYIRAMIGIGKSSDEIDKALSELFEDDEEIDFENMDEDKMSQALSRGRFLVIPLGSKISLESINVPEDVMIGNDCNISTRMICKRFESGKNLIFNGFIRSKGETLIGEGSRVSGEISASKVIIDKNVKIEGIITAKTVWIHETSFVEGKISSGNVRFITGDEFDIKDPGNAEKATLLSKADSFNLINTNVTEKKEEELFDDEEEIEDTESEEELTAEEVSETEEVADAEEVKETESGNEQAAEETEPLEVEPENAEEKPDKVEPAETNTSEVETTETETIETKAENEATSSQNKRKTASKRAQKRRSKKAAAEREDMTIVNVFTGENIEEIKNDDSDSGKENTETKK
ncbi:putative acyltransferase (DUF342 family) [Methanimicrococcus blatticola]|uniref:Putative acyltransferase (DUF342 family) n=2 Tax=Methanimicrococcus blatticola TaxID=91560 RepID=A0A484F6T8_9EURY|nr:polymer-forming cytoskeletal protein [Methanimicrococcus blatticola]MBZ3936186.1 hypothetical protein [Methanimicrococcus blatticola]MCC2508429.1 hypothetical protein [Methanimicrococcus blatticola]TDQ70118.1 putative acyltransferase (DUF342 family) [Methanimicrococcus blatticola]